MELVKEPASGVLELVIKLVKELIIKQLVELLVKE